MRWPAAGLAAGGAGQSAGVGGRCQQESSGPPALAQATFGDPRRGAFQFQLTETSLSAQKSFTQQPLPAGKRVFQLQGAAASSPAGRRSPRVVVDARASARPWSSGDLRARARNGLPACGPRVDPAFMVDPARKCPAGRGESDPPPSILAGRVARSVGASVNSAAASPGVVVGDLQRPPGQPIYDVVYMPVRLPGVSGTVARTLGPAPNAVRRRVTEQGME